MGKILIFLIISYKNHYFFFFLSSFFSMVNFKKIKISWNFLFASTRIHTQLNIRKYIILNITPTITCSYVWYCNYTLAIACTTTINNKNIFWVFFERIHNSKAYKVMTVIWELGIPNVVLQLPSGLGLWIKFFNILSPNTYPVTNKVNIFSCSEVLNVRSNIRSIKIIE